MLIEIANDDDLIIMRFNTRKPKNKEKLEMYESNNKYYISYGNKVLSFDDEYCRSQAYDELKIAQLGIYKTINKKIKIVTRLSELHEHTLCDDSCPYYDKHEDSCSIFETQDWIDDPRILERTDECIKIFGK